MEQQPQSPTQPLFQLNVDAHTGYTLKSAGSWAKVLGILGIIFGLLMIGGGIYFQMSLKENASVYDDFGYRNENILSQAGTIGMVIYIVMGVLTIIGSLFAMGFGNRISAAIRTNDQNSLRGGFASVRNYFAFWSILMIICLLLVIITLASALSTGM